MARPIIYVRGYSRNYSAIENTVDLPYYGFNVGSTRVRTGPDRNAELLIFESPLVRLLRDHGYQDYFCHIDDSRIEFLNQPKTPEKLPDKSLVIYRYYDDTSRELGTGQRLKIEELAENLASLVDLVRASSGVDRVDLVAHSMGGLICRSLVQRTWADGRATRRIGRIFTFGTPHKGISFQHIFSIGEAVRDLFGRYDADTFGARRMREYLGFDEDFPADRLHELGGSFPPSRVFSLIGTNPADYDVARGWSRRAVGSQSDGLVQIRNAYVKGSARAYVHRAHSGPLGIVNSEEGFQNLERFLFGTTRVKLTLTNVAFDRDWDGFEDLKFVLLESEIAIRGLPVHVHQRREEYLSAEDIEPGELERHGETIFESFLIPARKTRRGRYSHFHLRFRLVPRYVRQGLIRRDTLYAGQALFDIAMVIGIGDLGVDGSSRLRWGLGDSDDAIRTRSLALEPDDEGRCEQVLDLPCTTGGLKKAAVRLELARHKIE